jgi:hypothetical protein
MQSPSVDAVVDQRLAEIDALVEEEDFAGVERGIQSLHELAAGVTGESREAVLLKIQEFLAGVHAQAASKSEQVRAELQSLSSGRVAHNAYADVENLASLT